MKRLVVVLITTLAATATACGVGSDDATKRALPPLTEEVTTTTTTAPPTTTTTTVPCTDPRQSYAPLPRVPSGEEAGAEDPFMQSILENGRLVVAVDENTKYLAARNSVSSDLEGAEIDIAERIAQRIFGGELGEHVQFKTVTTKDKIAYPQAKKVDMSISAISMTCERWQQVAFSSVYLVARHMFLVRDESHIRAQDDLSGKRVCVTIGSTSIDIMETVNRGFIQQQRRPAVVVPVDARTDCLLQLQEGMVDAYLGHDTFLRGMRDQNPGLRIVDQGQEQPYGIAINNDVRHRYFVRYVNAVLAEMRDSGELQSLLSIAQKDLPPPADTRPLPQ